MATVNPFEVELRTIEFRNTLLLMLQQEQSSLRGAVDVGTGHVGRTASPVQYIAPMVYKQAGARGALLDAEYAQYQRRWVSPADKELVVRVDSFDLLRSIIDPKSAITMNINAAGQRLFDDVIMGGFFSTALIGEDPANQTTETFNSGSNFPISVHVDETFGAGVATGVTVAKIIEGLRILSKYENNLDMQQVHLGMTSQGLADLMKSAEFTSTDFRAQATYDMRGRPTSFMGCQFHYSERWPYDPADSDERWLPMWTTDGMHLGIWMDISPNISQETLIVSQPWQLYSKVTLGATRLQAGKVVRIGCLDGTGGSVTV